MYMKSMIVYEPLECCTLVCSGLASKKQDSVISTIALAYYFAAIITTVKGFIIQAL
jgi:hypothetical protein